MKADEVVDKGADKLETLADRAAAKGGVAAKVAGALADDASFLRKLKPSLMVPRAKGEAPKDQEPGSTPRAPRRPQLCPTSNLLTKALADEKAVRETLHAFLEHGVPFTIATDGPEMMRTHLRDELDLLRRIGALTEEQLREANRRGHEASFIRG